MGWGGWRKDPGDLLQDRELLRPGALGSFLSSSCCLDFQGSALPSLLLAACVAQLPPQQAAPDTGANASLLQS